MTQCEKLTLTGFAVGFACGAEAGASPNAGLTSLKVEITLITILNFNFMGVKMLSISSHFIIE